jgi:hypothetical protein
LPSLTVSVNSSGDAADGLLSTTSVEYDQLFVMLSVSGSKFRTCVRVSANTRQYLPRNVWLFIATNLHSTSTPVLNSEPLEYMAAAACSPSAPYPRTRGMSRAACAAGGMHAHEDRAMPHNTTLYAQ